MDKDGIMDVVLQYGHKRAAAAELFQMARDANTATEQANFRSHAETLLNQADWHYQRISRELGE